MNKLLQVGLRFRSRFYLINGLSFLGQMLSIPDTSRVSNFLSARRYLRTQPKTIIKPRDVMIANGIKYIIAEHGDGFYVDPLYKHFKLFEVDRLANWYIRRQVIDPVTKVESYEVPDVPEGKIYLSTQPHALIRDSINIPQDAIIVITNAPVAVDDKIGDYLVTKSDVVLGVTLAELRQI